MKGLLFFLGLLTSFCANSQFRTGVSAYYGRSIVTTDQEGQKEGESYLTKSGNNFLGGIYLNYRLNDWFGFQIDLLYDQINTFEGFYKVVNEEDIIIATPPSTEWPLRWFEEEQWIRMDYLSIPLSLEFKVKKWRFKIGAQYSYLAKIGSSAHHYSYYFNYDYGTDFEFANDFHYNNRHNFSGVVSCSYNLFANLFLDIRYANGFHNLSLDYIDHASLSRQLNFGLFYQILPRYKKLKKPIEEIPLED